jgi:endonuclease G, mitochondrial
MRLRIVAILAALVISPAAQAGCLNLFLGGQPPKLTGPQPGRRTGLCFEAYATLTSGFARVPIWSAEHLTAESAELGPHIPRTKGFHPERALPPDDRADPHDYGHDYDRGHMTPAGDASTKKAKAETFSLANVVPQTAALNRGVWEGIEEAVRRQAERDGELYIVTGPVLTRQDGWTWNGRVEVPGATWKAIYDPSVGTGGAWICTNTEAPDCRVVSIVALEKVTRVNPFPSLTEAQEAAEPVLPTPGPGRFWP